MAGATKCYKVTPDPKTNMQRELVSHSPKHADPPAKAARKFLDGQTVYVNPTRWIEFTEELAKQKRVVSTP
jgi:hypothetical protein